MNVATIQNINGQAITLAIKHKDKRDPKNVEGLQVRRAVRVLDAQLPAALLRGGSRPRTPTPTSRSAWCRRPRWWPTCAPATSTASSAPIPFNQRAVYDEVGFIHLLTKDIWDGHPCCAFGTSAEFIQQNPNTFAALYRAVLTAAAMARDPKNRELIAKVIAPAQYLNQPETVIDPGADRQVRRRPGQHQERARPRRLRPDAVAVAWRSGC